MTAILVVGLEPQPAAAPSHTHSADAPPNLSNYFLWRPFGLRGYGRLRAVTAVQPALLFLLLFPPPASAALGLSWRNGARAWGAANRQEAAVVQGVARHAMFPNKGGNLRARPVEERTDFDQIVCGVDRGKRYAGAFVRLVRAKPGDPRGGARKSPAKRLDFTDGTAGLPPLDRIEEPIDALAGDQRFNAYVIGIERRNSAAVLPFRLSPELIGLRKQTSRIERHHLNLKGLPEYRIARSPGPQARSSW
jgi:hypothetical protein